MKRRILGFAAAWMLAMAALAVSGLWRPVDHWVFRHFFLRAAPAPLESLMLLDVPYDRSAVEEQRFQVYRQRVAAALDDLARAVAHGEPEPAAVVLDIAFLKPADAGVDALVAALAGFRKVAPRAAVFAAVMPWKPSSTEPDPEYAARHLQDIYDRLDGAGHTAFAQHGELLFYPGAIPMPGSAQVSLPALPVVIARRLFRLGAGTEPEAVIVPLGGPSGFPVAAAQFDGDSARLAKPIEWRLRRDALVIAGELRRDVDNPLRRPGPELFAWAVSDLAVHSRDRSTREPLNHPGFSAGLVLLMAFTVVIGFHLALQWRLSRVEPSKAGERLWLPGLAALGLALVLLAGIATAFLIADRVVPVALAAAGAALAAVACVVIADRWLAQAVGDAQRFMRAFPQRFRYDVFVSYSREPTNAAWVEREVVAALRAARNARGEPLAIFFDKSEIAAGERWEDKILASLASSRVFLPVYSDDYFAKPYCRLEAELAALLEKAQRGPLVNLPIVKGAQVPEAFQAVQHVDASSDPAFMDKVVAAAVAATA